MYGSTSSILWLPFTQTQAAGNLQRPTCSRCAENGWQCRYSARKRKPGPVKGSIAKLRRVSKPFQKDGVAMLGVSDHIEAPLAHQYHPPPALSDGNRDSVSLLNTGQGADSGPPPTAQDRHSPPTESPWQSYQIIDCPPERTISLPQSELVFPHETELDL